MTQRTRKYRTRKYRTKKYRTRKYRTRKYRTRKYRGGVVFNTRPTNFLRAPSTVEPTIKK